MSELPEAVERVWEACFPMPTETAQQLKTTTEQLGGILTQMGQMILRMQQRLDELEEKQRAVTLSHDEVKAIMQLIRNRSMEYCEKYRITSPGNLRSITAGIKKAVLQRYGVKDLHDVPAIARQAVEAQIGHWSDIRLMARCRERLEDGS